MITLRDHDLRDGHMIPMTEYQKLRLVAILPVAFVLTVLNLFAYEAFLATWPKVAGGPDLSFLTYVIPAAGEAYAFHAACGYPIAPTDLTNRLALRQQNLRLAQVTNDLLHRKPLPRHSLIPSFERTQTPNSLTQHPDPVKGVGRSS